MVVDMFFMLWILMLLLAFMLNLFLRIFLDPNGEIVVNLSYIHMRTLGKIMEVLNVFLNQLFIGNK